MKFDLDSRIAENKERLKMDYDNLRNIQNSYGYIIIYVSFIGLTFFDFITFISQIDFNNIKIVELILLTSITVSLIFIYITLKNYLKLFIPKKVAHDKLPEFVYTKIFNEVGEWAKRNNKNPEEEIKHAYLETLEKAVRNNFNLYIYKRNLLYKTIKNALISIIPYFIAMILYNLLK